MAFKKGVMVGKLKTNNEALFASRVTENSTDLEPLERARAEDLECPETMIMGS